MSTTIESAQEHHFQHEYLQEDKPPLKRCTHSVQLREVGGVDPILVRAAEDGRDAYSSGELLRERSSCAACAIASVTVLAKSDLVGARVATLPLSPASRVDDIGESSVLKDNAGVVPPRAAEVERTSLHGVTGGSRYFRLIDDVVRGVRVRVATVGCDVANRGSKDADINPIEPSGSLLPENEVCGTCSSHQ